MERIKIFCVEGTVCRDYHDAATGDLLTFVGATGNGGHFFTICSAGNKFTNTSRVVTQRRTKCYSITDAFLLENEEEVYKFKKAEKKYRKLDRVLAEMSRLAT